MPLELNGNQYRTCLIDTNVISEAVKNSQQEFVQLVLLIVQNKYIPCISVFSLLELRRHPGLYERFLDVFSVIPCIFLKNHEQLFADEIQAYPAFHKVNPYLTTYLGPLAQPGNKLRDLLDKLFLSPLTVALEKQWNSRKESIIDGIQELKVNYPPKGEKYTSKEIKDFVNYALIQQIGRINSNFAQNILKSGKTIEIDSFPSQKIVLYTVFYKFYADDRKPIISDSFDLIINAPTPYVDAIITERHQAEVIRKVKQLDNFLDHVEVLTLRDLRAI